MATITLDPVTDRDIEVTRPSPATSRSEAPDISTSMGSSEEFLADAATTVDQSRSDARGAHVGSYTSLGADSAATTVAQREDTDHYLSRAFIPLHGGEAVSVQQHGELLSQARQEVLSVERDERYTRPTDLDADRFGDNRILKIGSYYPYINHEGVVPEGRSTSSHIPRWSVDTKFKPGLANEIDDISRETGIHVLGFRPIEFEKGWFGVFYTNNAGETKVGQFRVNEFSGKPGEFDQVVPAVVRYYGELEHKGTK